MRQFLRKNSLSVALLTLFALFWVGQSIAGWMDYNEDEKSQHHPPISYVHYLTTGHFVEATAENWESEWLEKGVFVLLTAWLFQKGSAESRSSPDEEPDEDETPRPDSPWPVRYGGAALRLYRHSLSIALFTLFAVSVVAHVWGGAAEYTREQLARGERGVTPLQYAGCAHFWFQALQNWQSEFLSTGALTVMAIYLREKGSPESKPVAAPHAKTGE